MAVIAFGNAFQAWVLDPTSSDVRRRHRLAILSHVGLGLLGGLALALLGPWATSLLFGAAVAAQPVPSALFGVAFFFLSSTTPLIRNILIPSQHYRVVFAATVAAAVVGLLTMIAGSAAGSAAIVSLGVAASEATAFVILVIPARRALRRILTDHEQVTPPEELPS